MSRTCVPRTRSLAFEPHLRRPPRPLPPAVRNPSLALVHSVVALLMGLITGLLLRNSDDSNQGALSSFVGL